jgi:hypothetical protein
MPFHAQDTAVRCVNLLGWTSKQCTFCRVLAGAGLHEYTTSITHVERYNQLRKAKNGGSVTPEYKRILDSLVQKGKLDIIERVEVRSAVWVEHASRECWKVEWDDKRVEHFDLIWLGTGSILDVEQDPCLTHILEKFPIEIVNGLPVLQDDLRWCRDCNLFVMSGYSALSVGPVAGNLLGGKVCAERIASSILKDWAKERGSELDENKENAKSVKKIDMQTLSGIAANSGNYWSALESCT